jgi:hypothetical protein
MADFIAVLALKNIDHPTAVELAEHTYSHFDCDLYDIPVTFIPKVTGVHPHLVSMAMGETIFFNCAYIRGVCAPRDAIHVRPLSVVQFEILPYDVPPMLLPGVDHFLWMPRPGRVGSPVTFGRDEQPQSFSDDAELLKQHRHRLARWSAQAMAYVQVRPEARYTITSGGLVEIQPCAKPPAHPGV